MADEPHDVVKLLVARMESHPEEFRVGIGPERWVTYIDMVQDYGNEADKAALNAKLRSILMDELHEQVLDELMNGPERRRKHAEDQEYERNMTRALQQSSYAQANQLLNQAYDYDLDKMVGVGTTAPTTKLDVAPSILGALKKGLVK
jgi:hypothetical protein